MASNYTLGINFLVRFIWPSVAEHKVKVAFSIFLLFLSTALFIGAMELSRLVIQAVQQMLDQHWIATVLATAGLTGSGQLLIGVGLSCLLCFTLASLVAYLRDIYFEEIALRLTASLRLQLFEHLLVTQFSVLRKYEPSVLVKRLINDLANVRLILVDALMLRGADAAMFIGLLAYLLTLSGALTALSLLLVASYFVVAEFSARLIGPGLYRMDASTEDMTAQLNQALQRVLDIKSNQMEKPELAAFDRLTESDYRIKKDTIKWLMLDRSMSGWLSAILPIIVTVVGGLQVVNGTLQLDEVLVFVAAINMLTRSVDRLTEIPMIISRTRVSMLNVSELFDLAREPVGERRSGTASDAVAAVSIAGFSRALSDKHTLEIARLEMAQGAKIAIIGPSGCGKSSLFSNLMKLDDRYQGSLQLLGMEVGTGNTEQIRAAIGFMHQHSMLLPQSVIDNVRYSRHGDTCDLDTIRHLLKIVDLSELLNADEGERDLATLSGGQKRRLCLARALYRQAPLLLLDEPLTGISPVACTQIVTYLLGRPETLLMVTHHYRDLDRFDQVILLGVTETPDGRVTRIAAQGSHAELMATNQEYRNVVEHD